VLKSKALGLKLTKAEIIEVSKKASSVHMIMAMTQREPLFLMTCFLWLAVGRVAATKVDRVAKDGWM
jgi:hypothetical protein